MYEQLEAFIAPTGTIPKGPSDTSFPTVIPNPPIFQRAGPAGERTLWVVFVLMLIATISFVVMSWRVPAAKRLYHSITTLIVVIATLSYFAMATKQGITFHHTRIKEHHKHGLPDTFRHVHREVYYARYIDWLLTTPLLIIDLSLLAGLNGASIFSAVIADIVMILTGLFSAFAYRRGSKWGWYAMACIAYLWVLYTLLFTARTTARAKGNKVQSFYTQIAVFTVVVWTAYPIIWALADGTRILSVNAEIIAYAVLDVLAKGVFGAWLLFTHARLPESNVSIGGFWAHGFNSEGTIRIQEEDGA